MGAIDLVIQVESPRSVARGLQRIGRAGHQVDAPSRGRIFPKYRGDLLECAAVVVAHARAAPSRRRACRATAARRAGAADRGDERGRGPWTVDELERGRAARYPFAELSREQLEGVLDMLAGRYPSDEFAELRPRIVWDRVAGHACAAARARARSRCRTRARSPTAGLFAVFLPDGARASASSTRRWSTRPAPGRRSCSAPRPGASRRSPATASSSRRRPGEPGTMPFWKGEGLGRPFELGERSGAFARELVRRRAASRRPRACASEQRLRRPRRRQPGRLPRGAGGGDRRACPATARSSSSASATSSATGASASSRPSAPASTRRGRWRSRRGCATGDGQRGARHLGRRRHRAAPARRRRGARGRRRAHRRPTSSRSWSSASSAARPSSARRFRENAARALLIPRRRPGQRTPLWQQRLKALRRCCRWRARFGSFPVILETYRECLNDWFDLPALRGLLGAVALARGRRGGGRDADRLAVRRLAAVRVRRLLHVRGRHARRRAPRAGAVAQPRPAARAARARRSCATCIDAEALAAVEADLQGRSERAPGPRARRPARPAAPHRRPLAGRGRGPPGRAGAAERSRRRWWPSGGRARSAWPASERLIAAEDAGRYRDALGAMPPSGLPDAFLEPVPDALRVDSWRATRARTGPSTPPSSPRRYALEPRAVEPALAALEADGTLVRGRAPPGRVGARVVRRRGRAPAAPAPASPRCGARSSPPTRGRSGASCRDWQRVDRPGGRARRRRPARRPRHAAGPRRSRPPSGRPRCCRARLADYGPARLDELAARGRDRLGGRRRRRRRRRPRGHLLPRGRRRCSARRRPTRRPRAPVRRTPCAPRWPAARASGTTCCAAGRRPRARRSSTRCGGWSGRARSPTTSGCRCARRAACRRCAGRAPARAGAWAAPAAARRRPSPGAGRSSERALPRRAARRRAPPRPRRADWWSATASSPARRRSPRACPAASPRSTRALSDLETLGRLPARLLPRGPRRRPVRHAGRGRAAARPARRARPTRARTSLVLGAADPAQPYGAAVPWPRREGANRSPSRVFGAQVALVDGAPVLYLERGGRRPAHLPGRRPARRPGARPSAPSPAGSPPTAAAASRSSASTASRSSARPSRRP